MPGSGPRDPLVCSRFIAEMMAARGNMTQTELARRLGHSNQGFISNVLAGRKPIPWDELRDWANALELSPEQVALLKRYAVRSYGPSCANEFIDALDDARAQVTALEREVATTKQAADAAMRYAEALEREVASLKAEREAAEARRRSG